MAMSARRRIVVLSCGACAALLAAVHVGTYVLWAESTMPLAGFRTLGFPRSDAHYSFIVLKGGLWESLPEGRRAALVEYLSRHADDIHLTPEDLPKGSINTYGDLFEYVNGVSVRWQLEDTGLFWMKSNCGYSMSSTGAEGRGDVHIWFLCGWVRLYNRYVYAA